MNSRVFVCRFVLLLVLLLPFAATVYAQQRPSLPTGPHDDNDGYIIPFQYDSLTEPQIIVQVSINGKPPLPFILDTGATAALTVFPEAVKTLGLQVSKQTADGEAFGQKLSLSTTSVESVRLIGVDGRDIILPLDQADIADDSVLPPANPFLPKMGGLIGLGMLVPDLTGIRFDFVSKTITAFTKTDLSQIKGSATILPMIKSDATGLFSVSIEYAWGKFSDLIVDTGCSLTQLPISAVSLLNPIAEKPNLFSSIAALYMTTDMLIGNLKIGAYSVPKVVVTPFPKSPTYSLGMNILSRFLITMDFRNKQMVVQQYPQPILYEPLLGFGGYDVEKRKGDFFVTKLLNGFSAKAAGVRVGDKILAIDGKTLRELSDRQLYLVRLKYAGTRISLLLERSNGKRITVSFQRGSEFDLPKTVTTGMILKRLANAPITILAVTKGCLREKAGLQEGDQITELDGKNVAAMSSIQLVTALSDDNLIMTIQHSGDKATRTVHLSTIVH